jgi:hypothetical protein
VSGARAPVVAGTAILGIGGRVDAAATAFGRQVGWAGTGAVGEADTVDATNGTARLLDLRRIGHGSTNPVDAGGNLAIVGAPAAGAAATTVFDIALVLVE